MVMLSSSSSMSKANNSLKARCNASSQKKHARIKQLNLESSRFDRPGISSLNKPIVSRLQEEHKKIPVPLVSSKEFVEKWLFNYNNANESVSTCSTVVFDSSSPKRVPLSPLKDSRQFKRLKCCNERKNSRSFLSCPTESRENQFKERIKNALDVFEDNKRTEKIDLPDNSLSLTPKIKVRKKIVTEEDLESVRRSFFGSPKQASPEKKYSKPISPQKHSPRRSYLAIFNRLSVRRGEKRQIIHRLDKDDENIVIDDAFGSPEHQTNYEINCESSRIIDSESPAPSPCILDTSQSDCASPLRMEIQSLGSPQIANECTELESSEINELDQIIDSEADQTLNEDIEDSASLLNATVIHDNHNNINLIDDNDNDTNRSPCKSSTKSESNFIISQYSSRDSDSTHFTGEQNIVEVEDEVVDEVEDERENEDEENDDIDNTLVVEECSQKISQSLSSTSLNIQESQSKSITTNNISSEASPPPTKKPELDNRTVVNPIVKRKKKPKKGSIVARLQTLIGTQSSFLKIWRYRVYHDLESNSESVTIKIKRRTFQYGRIYILGTIIEDKFNLLDKTDQRSNSSGSSNGSKNNLLLGRSITILIDPEIVGKIKFNYRSILNIYQPWEIIDGDKLILSILYFTVNIDNSVENYENINFEGETSDNVQNEEIISQQFNCPCLTAKRLIQSCDIKCSDKKPNVLQHMFDD